MKYLKYGLAGSLLITVFFTVFSSNTDKSDTIQFSQKAALKSFHGKFPESYVSNALQAWPIIINDMNPNLFRPRFSSENKENYYNSGFFTEYPLLSYLPLLYYDSAQCRYSKHKEYFTAEGIEFIERKSIKRLERCISRYVLSFYKFFDISYFSKTNKTNYRILFKSKEGLKRAKNFVYNIQSINQEQNCWFSRGNYINVRRK